MEDTGHDPYYVKNGDRDNMRDVSSFLPFLPEIRGSGPIKGLELLAQAVSDSGVNVVEFGAGLPDHARPQNVRDAMGKYARDTHAPYSRYLRKLDPDEVKAIQERGEEVPKNITEDDVMEPLVAYHKEVMGVESPENRFVITEGSTPALNLLIQMQADTKALHESTVWRKQVKEQLEKYGENAPQPEKPVEKKFRGEDCVLELFDLTYPLYKQPALAAGMEITQGIKLSTKLDIEDGKPIQIKPWALNRGSVHESFVKNRDKYTVFAFCNPANPSGHVFSFDEMNFLAKELLEDFQERRKAGMSAKMVLEDIAYITMMHDDDHKPYSLVHALNHLYEEAVKDHADEALLNDILDCKQTVVTVHSLSKAAAEAGDRVAYTEGHPRIIGSLRQSYTDLMLSYANASLHAAKASFEALKPDRDVMREYSTRVQAFEKGMNSAYYRMMDEKGYALSQEAIQESIPFANCSSGSFFTVMSMKPLQGQVVDPGTVAHIKDWIGLLGNENGAATSIGEVFKDGKIGTERDMSLYFMYKTWEYGGTAVTSVPIDGTGMLRFSMGNAPVKRVDQAVAAAAQFFMQDPLYQKGLEALQKAPDTRVTQPFRIDALGIPHAMGMRA